MICTSNYENFGKAVCGYKTYSISGDKGKQEDFVGNTFSKLAPKKSFWKVWKNNIGKISEEENNKYYISQYFMHVLSNLDPEEIYNKLDFSILLCYESSNEFCHRHIVAAWFELFLDVKVDEIVIENGNIVRICRPKYIKKHLEEVIKKHTNMKGFNSIRALYIFEKANALDSKADKLEESSNKCYDNYRQTAAFLRSEADYIESTYNSKII